jgi:hypothetical protein
MMTMSLRISVVASTIAILMIASPSIGWAGTIEAQFNETGPAGPYRSGGHSSLQSPCDPDAFTCGTGTVSGFGSATDQVFFVSFNQVSRSCADVELVRVIRLNQGSFTLQSDGTMCSGGNSLNAPGDFKSWGNPFRYNGTWVVTDGTGDFTGATGTGSDQMTGSGGYATSVLSGDIELT